MHQADRVLFTADEMQVLYMNSIRTKITLLTVCAIIIALSVATAIGVVSIRKLGRNDSDQMIHLTAATGALNLESYFESVEHSAETVATLVQDGFDGMPFENLEEQVEGSRNLFGRIANNTNGVLTYYYRIDPEVSETVKGFWYVNQDGNGFVEHEVTDISQYDTNDTSQLVWFTVPKATGKGIWLPPYNTENLDALVISYNVPVYWKNQFVGVIGIEMNYEMLAREVEKIKIFQTGYAFILDEDSKVIYHPLIDSDRLNLEPTALNDSDQFIGSNHIRYSYEGIEKEAVWIPLRNGMRLYVAAPVSEINRGWQGMVWNILLAALVILAVTSIVTMRFSNRITKPLSDLTEAAKQVQNGNYETELTYDKNDEVGILTRTFRQLTSHTKQNLSEARRMATIDSLTGIKNKHAYRQWEEDIDAEIKKGTQEPFAVAVCDINDLKTVNDMYGHKEGDACIRHACVKICDVFSHSPVFRIGGDEFAVILTGEDYFQRKRLMEQINDIPKDSSKIRIGETVSAGMSEYDPDKHTSLLCVFEEADKAMYERKQYLKENILPKENSAEENMPYAYIPVIHTRKQILVVDDMEMNREIMGDLLKDEYDILYASDGAEALEVLRSHKNEVDLVLLDLQMPKMNGREVIAEMQVDEDLMLIPVIFLTVDQTAELDCLRSGAMDFIPKPYPDIEIVKARIAKCIELSEDRELIRYTERDKLTGLLNKDYFYRYVRRLDNIYKNGVLDAVVCDINQFHSAKKQYGRQFGDQVLRSIGGNIRKLARKTGGIGCRKDGDTFLLYCPHQDDYEQFFREFVSDVLEDEEATSNISLRFGVFADAQKEPDIEERFAKAELAADQVKDDTQKMYRFYNLNGSNV